MDIKIEDKNTTVLEHEFEMPECVFCATCGSCDYYKQYGFGKAFCNYHEHDVSSSDPACGYYR